MRSLILILCVLAIPMVWDAPAVAGCQAYNSTQTYTAGQPIPDVCDTHGARKVMTVDANGDYVAGGGGGGQLQDPAWDSPRRSPFWRR